MSIRVWKRALFRRRHGALIDALRRSNELLVGIGNNPYHREEVEHIRQVNWRLLREYDPNAATDRLVA
jgi:hypothetical protein